MDVVLAFGQRPIRPTTHEVETSAQVLVLIALIPVRAVVLALVHHEEDVLEIGGAVGPFQRERGSSRAIGFVWPGLARTANLPRALAFAVLSPSAVRLQDEHEVMECNWLQDDERIVHIERAGWIN